MQILGGFAGHGVHQGVTVSPSDLKRHCNDCGRSWLPFEDVSVRNSIACRVDGRPMGSGHPSADPTSAPSSETTPPAAA